MTPDPRENEIVVADVEDSTADDVVVVDESVTASKPKGHWKILVLGQCLSFLFATMWASQSTLYLQCEWSSPAFSCLWSFFLLSLHMLWQIRKGRKDDPSFTPSHWFLGCVPLHVTAWAYFGMAFLSFYAIYFSLSALRYTTITSIAIFDALAIPTAMILSRIFLGRRYVRLHLLGVTFCCLGIFINMTMDLISNHEYRLKELDDAMNGSNHTLTDMDDGSREYPEKILGDMMACLGGVLFGANDVVAELAVRRYGGATEYLAMVGFFGVFLALIQMTIFERQSIADIFHGTTTGDCSRDFTAGLLIAYVIGQFSRKAGMALFLTMSDAALLNLSLLTSDLYSAVFSIIYQGIYPRYPSWFAMVLVLCGIFVYETGPSPILKEAPASDQEGVVNEEEDSAGKVELRSKIV